MNLLTTLFLTFWLLPFILAIIVEVLLSYDECTSVKHPDDPITIGEVCSYLNDYRQKMIFASICPLVGWQILFLELNEEGYILEDMFQKSFVGQWILLAYNVVKFMFLLAIWLPFALVVYPSLAFIWLFKKIGHFIGSIRIR